MFADILLAYLMLRINLAYWHLQAYVR
jgi:hypothetical protein